MAYELTPDQVEAISEALASGNKLKAIKLYREVSGKGLKESKDFIDALIPQLVQQDPERFAQAGIENNSGCSIKVALVAGATVFAALSRWFLS
jgi:ribosomal protein L7/L12